MRVVIAGGAGSLGRRLADFFTDRGDDVTILTRSPHPDLAHRQLRWDGRTVGPWASELEGAVLVNLAGQLVDCRSTARNVLRTGLVLDRGMPALDRLSQLTRAGLGGRIGQGRQWVTWIHVDDFCRAVAFLCDHDVQGIVHLCSPNPIRNRDMMATFRRTLHRPWSPPTPALLVRLGAFAMGSDAALALLGRRCVPRRLLDEGFEFDHPRFDDTIRTLVSGQSRCDRPKYSSAIFDRPVA